MAPPSADGVAEKKGVRVGNLRRCGRWVMFVLCLALVAVVWLWVLWDRRVVKVFGVNPANSLELRVDNCHVVFGRVDDPTYSLGIFRDVFATRGNEVDRSQLVVAVAAHDVGGSFHDELAPGEFLFSHTVDALSERYACRNNPMLCRSCRVFVLAQNDAPWPNVTTIRSNSTATPVEVSDFVFGEPLVAPNSSLVVSAPLARVSLSEAVLGHLDISLQSGSVHLPELTLKGSVDPASAEGSRIVSGDGDIFVSFRQSVNVTYFQQHSRSCIVAPEVASFTEACHTWNSTNNKTFTSCRGSALLCGKGDDCDVYSDDEHPQIYLESTTGSVHMSVIAGLSDLAAALVDPGSSIATAALQVRRFVPLCRWISRVVDVVAVSFSSWHRWYRWWVNWFASFAGWQMRGLRSARASGQHHRSYRAWHAAPECTRRPVRRVCDNQCVSHAGHSGKLHVADSRRESTPSK